MKKQTAIVLLIVGIAALTGVLIWGISGGFSWGMEAPHVSYGAADTIIYSEEVSGSYIRNIDIDLIEQDLTITAGKGNTIKIVQYGPNGGVDDKYLIRTDQSGDTLRVMRKPESGSWVLFGWSTVPYTKVELTVPAEIAGKLDAATVSGGIHVDGLKANEIDAATTSADIVLRSVECQELDVETTSGSVRLTDTVADKLAAGAVSGGVSVDGASSAGTTDLSTISGDVRCRLDSLREFHGNSTSGSIQLDIADAADLLGIRAETISGGVSIELPAGTKINTDFSSISGSTRVGLDGSGSIVVSTDGIPIVVSTTSGDLTVAAS